MTPFRISKLEINNIGPFGNITLDFPEKPVDAVGKAEIHIFTGENGTGKSTVLEILTGCFYQHVHIDSQTANNLLADKKRYTDSKSRYTILYSNNERYTWSYQGVINSPTNPKQFRSADSVKYNAIASYWQSYPQWATSRFQIAFFAYSGYRRVTNTNLSAIQELQTNPFLNALDFQKSINAQLILQWIANVISKEAISKSQGGDDTAIRYRNTISQIEKAISLIIEKRIRFFLDLEPLDVKIEVDGEKLNFNQLPDGLKSIV